MTETSNYAPPGERPQDFTRLDDFTLISVRAEMRGRLERLSPRSAGHAALSRAYDASTEEIDARARAARAGRAEAR